VHESKRERLDRRDRSRDRCRGDDPFERQRREPGRDPQRGPYERDQRSGQQQMMRQHRQRHISPAASRQGQSSRAV
jgi:hypothetical protein